MSTALQVLTSKLAKQFDMGDGRELTDTLKSTAFKSGNNQPVTDAQMTALLVVANQYGLNPFTKEIFAFPDKGGIVPVVGVDGWSRIINDHPQFDGVDFEQDAESCTCVIHRKDRNHPVKVTEYMSECERGTGPWKSHPRRMLRHKALIQCARLAFGYTGIYDEDEAERIKEAKDMGDIIPEPRHPAELPEYTAEQFDKAMPSWITLVGNGKTPGSIIATVGSKYKLSDAQKEKINSIGKASTKTEDAIDAEWIEDYEREPGEEG